MEAVGEGAWYLYRSLCHLGITREHVSIFIRLQDLTLVCDIDSDILNG